MNLNSRKYTSEKLFDDGTIAVYMIGVSELPMFRSYKEYREFAENIFDVFGHKLYRFGAWFSKKQLFGDRKSYRYSESKNVFFDLIPLSEFGGIHFDGINEKRVAGRSSDFSLNFTLSYDEKLYTTVVFPSSFITYEMLMDHAERFKKMLQQISKVEFIIADIMDEKKWVDSFAAGIGFDQRSDYQNEVSISISRTKRRHHKLPYLFTYSYIKNEKCSLLSMPEHAEYSEQDGYVTLSLPRCFGKELEEYPTFPEWASVYKEFHEKGEMVVTGALEKMIEQIMKSGNRTEEAAETINAIKNKTILDPNNLDIMDVKKDGSVDFYIYATEGLDDSPETQTALLDKIQNYLGYIDSSEFEDDYGKLPPEKIRIILGVDKPLSEVHTLLFERIVPWVKKGGATILWKITTPGNKRLPDSFFEWAFNDFWLLMSLTPNEEGDDLTIIMENWETLNRAFSFDELNSAMSKLIQNGYAERCGIGRFRQAEKALNFFNENHIVEEIAVEKLKRLEKKFIALPILKEVHYVEYFSKGEFHLAETGGKKWKERIDDSTMKI